MWSLEFFSHHLPYSGVIQSFSTPRAHPGGSGMAPHCLEEGTVWSVVAEGFQGTNWEKATKEPKRIKTMSE